MEKAAQMKMNAAPSQVFVKMAVVPTSLEVTDVNVMKDSSPAHLELSVLITAKAFALLKSYRPCVRWPLAAAILSPNQSVAVMEEEAGATSVSFAHFQEPLNTRNFVHMDQGIPLMEQILMSVR